VLRIFIALKNPLPRPSLNSLTSGKMAGTLTVTPPTHNNNVVTTTLLWGHDNINGKFNLFLYLYEV
jgi:hypothetical protein